MADTGRDDKDYAIATAVCSTLSIYVDEVEGSIYSHGSICACAMEQLRTVDTPGRAAFA